MSEESKRKIKYVNFFTSAISTCLAEILTQPICLVRTRLINSPLYSTVKDRILTTSIVKELYKTDGILGFFKASPPAVLSQMISSSLKYGIYSNNHTDVFSQKVLNGMLGGILVCTITNPIDVIRVKAQMLDTKISFNSLGSNFKFLMSNPISFYYQGYAPALWKATTGGAIYFPLKDYLTSKTDNNVIASMLSAIIATTICQPADWLKTRLMSGEKFKLSQMKYSYKGYTLNLIRIVPHFTITMCIYDHLNTLVKNK